MSKFKCQSYINKIKQTKIAKGFKKINSKFHILLFGYKQPVWSLFEKSCFDCILLETYNLIWNKCIQLFKNVSKYNYIYLDLCILIHNF